MSQTVLPYISMRKQRVSKGFWAKPNELSPMDRAKSVGMIRFAHVKTAWRFAHHVTIVKYIYPICIAFWQFEALGPYYGLLQKTIV